MRIIIDVFALYSRPTKQENWKTTIYRLFKSSSESNSIIWTSRQVLSRFYRGIISHQISKQTCFKTFAVLHTRPNSCNTTTLFFSFLKCCALLIKCSFQLNALEFKVRHNLYRHIMTLPYLYYRVISNSITQPTITFQFQINTHNASRIVSNI